MAAIAKLLFLLALLGQALTAPLGGMRAHGEAARLCLVAHVEAGEPSAEIGKQAPKSDQSHRHGGCAFCELGAGAPPLLTTMAWVATQPPRAHAAGAIFAFAGAPFSRDDDNAPTRAPPPFS
ncbi:hypothetical protein MSC49_01960 [Methylosinus sp. C49]|jgi:hypothetical protein|uniref:DUF2946 family protein n=1 Tax=Methylosinus sp. C49 TaxID=2699395 RepID=UPI00136698EB|nr:DUF2946 family protein [Methylosinus sp. C49]BBU60261.1 hypothetical protein MSC49_01960 [Methylosinus sp. C49]